MAVKKRDLFPIILDILEREQPSHLALPEIYSRISRRVNLTSEDRIAPRSHGKDHVDEEWKKQTRLALLDMVRDGRVANPSRERYCLPIASQDYTLLQADAFWQNVVANAREYSTAGIGFCSPILRHGYRIGNVDGDSIEVIRLDSDKSATLKKAHVAKGIQNLNSCAGVVGRRTVNYTVALEAAFVELSDLVSWSDDYENICVTSAKVRAHDWSAIEDAEENEHREDIVGKEGALRTHLREERARDKRLPRLKRRQAFRRDGGYVCEVCGIDWQVRFGTKTPVIDCHHLSPLAEANHPVSTTLDDLALVCPTCHRALHASSDPSNLEMLRQKLKQSDTE